jgi:hypothetical protein
LIFMAGTREEFGVNYINYDHPNIILEIGGVVGFHAPLFPVGEGNFSTKEIRDSFNSGIRVVRELRRKLENAMPADLFIEMLSRGPDQFLTVDTVYDALRWEIDLKGYSEPKISRETLLNACLNDAAWKHKRPLSTITGLELIDENISVLKDGEEVLYDIGGSPIPAESYYLPAEDDEHLIFMRDNLRAPSLLKLVKSEDGSLASQFAFDLGDTLAYSWCTGVQSATWGGGILLFWGPFKDELNINGFWEPLNVNSLLVEVARGRVTRRMVEVPRWYTYLPGILLSSIDARRSKESVNP